MTRRSPRRPREDVTKAAHGRGGGGVAPDVVTAARQLGTPERPLQRGYFFDSVRLKRHAAPPT